MEVEFRNLLLSDAAVTGIVGTSIDWGVSPQGSPMPRITLQLVGGNVQGFSFQGGDGFYNARVQIGCYSDSYKGAADMAAALKAGLDGYNGGIFQDVFCVSERDEYAGGVTDSARIYGKQLDFEINWSRQDGTI